MKFTALPVKVGDAFLLETTEKHTILVDGGMNQSHIIQLLNNPHIKNNHITLLVCTHYDADH
jgi:beta-lactamase superfamily II metal-dependent hydrolase